MARGAPIWGCVRPSESDRACDRPKCRVASLSLFSNIPGPAGKFAHESFYNVLYKHNALYKLGYASGVSSKF